MSSHFSSFIYLLLVIVKALASSKPNIILILTDDQDVTLHGMFPMNNAQKYIAAAGATLTNAFTTSPLCCPSRASILTGKYAHNHGTTNNSVIGGCYSEHWRSKMEPRALPVLLQNGGYDTFFAGKYLNEYNGGKVPAGWTDFHGLLGNSVYYNYTMRENDKKNKYTNKYLTDLISDLALKFLIEHAKNKSGSPFFVMISPPAAHSPFTPADRHRNAFAGIKALRTPNFNHRSETLEKHWLVSSSRLIPPETIATMDKYFQQRWETLLAVDELVASVLDRLEQQKQLENTYIIYTSDNGYHIGQFAQPFDKRQPYETDIRVPLLIRGPGIDSGVKLNSPMALLDLFPTILEWAQLPPITDLDGESMHAFLTNSVAYDVLSDKEFRRSLLVQHWGEGSERTYNDACPWARTDRLAECTMDADCHCQDAWNNTYACIRHFRYNTDRLYCEFKDNEDFVEAYDLSDDPYQMANIGYELLPIERAFYNLALNNLTQCAGASCKDINI